MTAPNTLGLDDDLDSVELVIAIERAFDIKVADQDAAQIYSMGDLHDLVMRSLDGAGGEKCQTSMSFYRVRRFLKLVVGDIDISPSTQLKSLWTKSPRRLFDQVQRYCDLRLAPLTQTNVTGLGALIVLAALLGLPVLLIARSDASILATAGALLVVGFALTRLDPLAFGEMTTVGDLARRTAMQNYGTLARNGGRTSSDTIWEALVEIAQPFSENLSTAQIERDTVILQSQFDSMSA